MTKFSYDFPMSPVAITMVLFYRRNDEEISVCLGKRGGETFTGMWSLPGGYMEAGEESSRETASRETMEEMGIEVPSHHWAIIGSQDTPGADPRYKQVINICYAVEVNEQQMLSARAADDLAEIDWVNIEDAHGMELAFRHNEVLDAAIRMYPEGLSHRYRSFIK